MIEFISEFWAGMSWMSRVSLLTGLIYIVLNVMRKPVCWLFGIVSCGLWMVEAAVSFHLWMDAFIQLIYVVMGGWAWWQWLHGGTDKGAVEGELDSIRVRFLPARWWLALLGGGVALVGVFGYLYTTQPWVETAYPWWDTTTTVMGILAMVLVARRYIDNWYLWLVYNPMMIYIYHLKGGMQGYMALTVVYWIMAAAGLAAWVAAWRAQRHTAASDGAAADAAGEGSATNA